MLGLNVVGLLFSCVAVIYFHVQIKMKDSPFTRYRYYQNPPVSITSPYGMLSPYRLPITQGPSLELNPIFKTSVRFILHALAMMHNLLATLFVLLRQGMSYKSVVAMIDLLSSVLNLRDPFKDAMRLLLHYARSSGWRLEILDQFLLTDKERCDILDVCVEL